MASDQEDEKPKKKMGRPKIEINMDKLAVACRIHCTLDECAALFDCDADTISARLKEEGWPTFSAFYKTHQGQGNVSLRRMQWETASKGNATMQIWLGKQMLGQADKVEHGHGGIGGGPIPVSGTWRDVLRQETDQAPEEDEEDGE